MNLPNKLRVAFLVFFLIIVFIMPGIASIIEVGPTGAADRSNETFANKFQPFILSGSVQELGKFTLKKVSNL